MSEERALIDPRYVMTIGLEVHCQLQTKTKLFSGALSDFGGAPNTQVNEVELGLPGALPVLNARAVELAVRAGLGLGCRINTTSVFARKNYFYADLPRGYQISQHDKPLCEDGELSVQLEGQPERVIRIERIHMEEDAGKSTHMSEPAQTLVDLNRAGVPLIEIVTRPDFDDPAQVVAFLKALHAIVVQLGVCDGNMEQGSFRCDANVSVRRREDQQLGTRAEIKNVNSFKFVRDAIIFEARRQVALLEAGQPVIQQTRLYDPDRGQTFAMRDKEDAHDYRFFPEPDLPTLVLDPAWLVEVLATQPELPRARQARYEARLGLSPYDASALAADLALAAWFERALEAAPVGSAKTVANWILNDVQREAKEAGLDALPFAPEAIGALVRLIEDDTISTKIARVVFDHMRAGEGDPALIVEARGLRQITDLAALNALIDVAFTTHALKVTQYRQGQDKLFGFFVGQLMKASGGQASPTHLNALLKQRLDAPEEP